MLTQEVRGRQTVTEMELERIGPLYASLDSGQFGARRGRFRQGYAEAVTKLRRLLEQYKEHGRKQEVLNMGKDPLGCSTSCALTSSSEGDSWPDQIRSGRS